MKPNKPENKDNSLQKDLQQKKSSTFTHETVSLASSLLLPISVVFLAFCLSGSMIISALILSKSIKENGIATNNTSSTSSNTSSTSTTTTTTSALRQPNAGEVTVEGIDPGSLTLGSSSAKVKIVEYADFECLFCKKFHDDTYANLKKTYIDTGKVQFAFKHYPNPQLHPNPIDPANASMCANEQGKFWEYHDKLYNEDITNLVDQANFKKANEDNFLKWAGDIGLNVPQFKTCYEVKKYQSAIDKDVASFTDVSAKYAANAKLISGIDPQSTGTGTPTFFINGKVVGGAYPFSAFQTIIDSELKK